MYKPPLIILVLTLITTSAKASESPIIPPKRAVAAIVGEASGEGGSDRIFKYQAFLAVAHAIRNRGSLKGDRKSVV